MTHLDKSSIKHFGVCAILSVALGLYGVSATIGASITKEYIDSKQKGNHWCWVDITCDALGCVVGYGIRLCLTYMLQL